MGIEKVFVYNDLLDVDKFNYTLRGHGRVISIVPAYVRGKLFHANKKRFPIAVLIDNMRKRNSIKNIVYGGIATIETDDSTFKVLDGYNGNSREFLMENDEDNDLFLRVKVKAQEIDFDSMDSFLNCDYRLLGEGVDVWIYVGNPRRNEIMAKINQHKSRAGHLWRSFISAFSNYKLLEEIHKYSK